MWSSLRRLAAAAAIAAAAASLGACRRSAELPPVLGEAAAFALVDEDGAPADSARYSGAPWVASFVFTSCPTVCPRMMGHMAALQREARARSLPLRLVSFTVDPENDTPEKLRAFGERFGADLSQWDLLTGDEGTLTAVSEGMKLAVERDAGADVGGILHGSHLVLVDGAGRLRGYYRTEAASDRRALLDALEAVAAEARPSRVP